MRPLPAGTRYLAPRCVREALSMKADHPRDGLFVAGGTDLYYNLKSGLGPTAPVLIDLTRLPANDLRAVGWEGDGTLRVGALATLAEVSGKEGLLRACFPALAESAGLVGAPQHRQVGTIGGNLALDTRCHYYNQDPLWREALGGCLKAEGTVCHVTGSSSRCVARRAGDTVAPFLLYGALVEYETLEGVGQMPIAGVFTGDGLFGPHLGLPDGAFIWGIILPSLKEGFRASYEKIAPRRAFDFPQISLAVGGQFTPLGCEEVTIVVSSVRPKPRVMRFHVGGNLTLDRIAEIAHTVEAGVKPMTNIQGDPSFQSWRARVAGVHVARALTELVRSDN
ncbi:TPA: hypothetical protein DDZ10_04030 [Candidatus Uhrbacteria bacterium]|nr:MAG: hypothetical protein A3D69_02315 [Candidatus Uhrbacteria bacterium RIFCSPHIGHO2_02_FULL_54_11]HBL39809.1 hypothetical protein [Candidatus Uhrbacteria bacterium]